MRSVPGSAGGDIGTEQMPRRAAATLCPRPSPPDPSESGCRHVSLGQWVTSPTRSGIRLWHFPAFLPRSLSRRDSEDSGRQDPLSLQPQAAEFPVGLVPVSWPLKGTVRGGWGQAQPLPRQGRLARVGQAASDKQLPRSTGSLSLQVERSPTSGRMFLWVRKCPRQAPGLQGCGIPSLPPR